MRHDLHTLSTKNHTSSETIKQLNRELNAQLHTVECLKEQLAEENADLRRRLSSVNGNAEFIGHSEPFCRLLEQAEQTAPLPINVLVTGESGTGKELLANFLHHHGSRTSKPFVKVNCAALPTALIESELFGHEKGAFTGAVTQRKGQFELAHNGTLFLDEIGELPLESQSKLLRALQQGEIQRVGGNTPIIVDVRLIAATNRNLADEVANGTFREDLYYRLKVIELHCPSLRERIEDLPGLAQHFVEHFSSKLERTVVGISPNALQCLAKYSWPGNVRELEHAIARAVALTTTQVLGPDDFRFLTTTDLSSGTNSPEDSVSILDTLLSAHGLEYISPIAGRWDRIHEACERACLNDALAQTKNQKEAAALLGVSPTKMHRLIRKYGNKHNSAIT
jgi:two-component system response regulator HydG